MLINSAPTKALKLSLSQHTVHGMNCKYNGSPRKRPNHHWAVFVQSCFGLSRLFFLFFFKQQQQRYDMVLLHLSTSTDSQLWSMKSKKFPISSLLNTVWNSFLTTWCKTEWAGKGSLTRCSDTWVLFLAVQLFLLYLFMVIWHIKF